MSPDEDWTGYEHVLVAVDRPPSGRWNEPDRRCSQLFAELRHLWPQAGITAIATDLDPTDPAAGWLASLGVELVGPPRDWTAWLKEHRLEFSVVIVVGHGVGRRLLQPIRATQPQALVVVDEAGAHGFARRGYTEVLTHAEERQGAAFVADFDDRRAQPVLGEADIVLSNTTFDGVTRPRATTPFDRREGVVFVGRFAAEFGEPDEEALHRNLADVVPRLQARTPALPFRFVLSEPAPVLVERLLDRGFEVDGLHAIERVLDASRVLVLHRPFGLDPTWLRRLAVETGIATCEPVDDADLAGGGFASRVHLVHDDEHAWATAGGGDGRQPSAAGRDGERAGLIGLLIAAGFAPPATDARTAAPATLLGPRAPLPFDPHGSARCFQGQIQTKGWAEHRPINPVVARADFQPEALWPHTGYHWWYDAHRLSDGAAEQLRHLAVGFPLRPTISLLMPVYNTDPDVLEEAIASVRAQLYRSWQLCIVDDGSTRDDTVRTLAELAQLDDRIVVQRAAENLGIAGASNAALAMATGEFVGLLDHDDTLIPEALFEVVALLNEFPTLDFVYSDEDKIDERGAPTTPFFKPSWSPDLHLCVNYVTHFAVYRRSLLDAIGGFRTGVDGSQDYDLSLRATERTDRVGHIAKPLYQWRMVPGSAAVAHDAKPYAVIAAKKVVSEALGRRGAGTRVDDGLVPGTWRPRYPVVASPLVSILIPTRNGRGLLEHCLTSLYARTGYRNFEIVIIDNGSDDPDTLDYLTGLDANIVRYPYRFNYARQMNLAVAAAQGELLLFLNNDMTITNEGWLEAMVEHAQRNEIGGVGARLVFPSGRPQHEGVFVGYGGGAAGNIDFGGYFGLGQMIRNATAVTAACMMTRLEVFHAVGGFDERLRVAFNDVDLCLRIRQRGYRIIYTPYAELVHAESASRGSLHPAEDEAFFVRRWGGADDLADPFYNPNLDPLRPFRLKR